MSASAAPTAPAAQPERADLLAWLAVGAGTLGAFMALLDVSIVNAALPIIQGEIGATQSEGTWVNTAYLVAEIVVIPLTAWLERLLGLRLVLIVGATLFTAFSVLCGLSPDLLTIIVGRIGQGLAGGMLIPTGMTIMAKRLPPSQQSIGMAIFAAAGLLGPILGPLLGGWITENYSWHYAFFINLPIGVGMVLLILTSLPPEQGDRQELVNADWFGIAGMTIGLGTVTVLLEEGHREQWFESPLIWKLAITSLVGFILVSVGQFRAKRPVLMLSLLRDRGLAANLVLIMVSGALLFCTLFAIPQFLVMIADYNTQQAGQIIFLSGAVAILGVFLYPLVIAYLDVRIIVGVATLMVSIASFLSSKLTTDSTGDAFLTGQLFLGVGLVFITIPLQQSAISSVPVEDAGQATSLFNISRNLGASVGLAALAGFLEQRMEFHHWRLLDAIRANDPQLHARLSEMSAGFGGGPTGMNAAIRALDGQVMREAVVMTFSDVFLVLSTLSALAIPLVLFLRPIDPERAQGMMH